MTTRQTLRNYLSDVGLSSANIISYNIDPSSGGTSSSDSAVDEGDDLGNDPNTSIPIIGFDSTSTEFGGPIAGGYAAYITKKNTFSLKSGAARASSPIRGNQLTPAEDQGSTSIFATSISEGLNKSDSGYYPSIGIQLTDVVKKNGSELGLSGHDLLPDTIASPDDPESIDQTSAVKGTFAFLKEYNKYSQSELYTVDNSLPVDSKEYELNTKYNFQTAAGKYEVPITEISNEISYDQIKLTGTSLLLKAAGWDTSTIAIDSIDPATFSSRLDTENTDILSKFPESSTKSIPDSPRARDAFGFPTDANGYSILEGNGDVLQKDVSDSKYMLSNGVAYTSETPFINYKGNDNETKVMAYQAAISIIGLAGLIEDELIRQEEYYAEIGLTTTINADNIPTLLTRGPYVIGSSLKSSVTVKNRAIIKSIFIPTGIFQYKECVREGLYHYFGITNITAITSAINNTKTLIGIHSDNLKKIVNSVNGDHLSLSYGFWHAVSRSAINIIKSFENATATVSAKQTAEFILQLRESKITKIMNVFATIGYQILVIDQVSLIGELKKQKPFDLDNMMTTPASRVMKSRDGRGPSPLSLVWRNSCLPSSFILSHEALSAMLDMDYTLSKELGGNPIKGMYGSTLQNKTYVTTSKGRSSIPSPVAKRLEARLGAEYVPFYFRDLRTNEVIAFHAFLESLTDGFTAQYAETKSYGRADAIKNYSGTTRSIGLSFWVVSTSKEDFNEMWYKINKLVTFVYPSYTAGRQVSITNKPFDMGNILPEKVSFEQPFSQVVGGTPVIRMRVGDLIKSNYSRSNMARVMGVGGENFSVTNDITEGLTKLIGSGDLLDTIKDIASFTDVRLAPFLAIAGSPMELEFYGDILARGNISNATGVAATLAASTVGFDMLSTLLENGFVNPLLGLRGIGSSFGDGDWEKVNTEDISGYEPAGGPEILAHQTDDNLLGTFGILKPNTTPYIFENDKGDVYKVRLSRAVNVKLLRFSGTSAGTNTYADRTDVDFNGDKTVFVKVTDTAVSSMLVGTQNNVSLGDLKCRVRTDDVMIDPFTIVDPLGYPGATLMIGLVTQALGTGLAVGSDALANAAAASGLPFDTSLLGDTGGSAARRLTSPLYNPIVSAIEDKMGEGLAGVCKSITFGWMEAPWEIDIKSRAPMVCKVTLAFDPIHDISPGIDVNGFNRAPVYKVGDVMHNTFGSPMSDGGAAEKLFYKKAGVDVNNPGSIDAASSRNK